MPCRVICLIIFSFFMFCGNVAALEICGDLRQGELLLIKGNNYKKIRVDNNSGKTEYKPNETGTILLALHRDAPVNLPIEFFFENDDVAHYELPVAQTKWDVQHIKGVKQHKVTPDKSHDAEIMRERNEVAGATKHYDLRTDWAGGFIVPVEGKTSGSFGNQRVFNGIPKSPHSGEDIAAPEGTPVKASSDGMVVLSGKDYFYTGNMLIIDHGQGLQTIYAHLQDSLVEVGDKIRKGQVIGHVGQTGRATGPHLHWGASVNNVRFNPRSLLNLNNKSCIKVDSKYKADEIDND